MRFELCCSVLRDRANIVKRIAKDSSFLSLACDIFQLLLVVFTPRGNHSSMVSLSENASRIRQDSSLGSPRNFCRTSSKFARGILNPWSGRRISRGLLIVVSPLLISPSTILLRSFVRSCSNTIFHLSLRCKSCFARKFLLLQLNSRTLVIYVNKNMVPFREGRNILSPLLGEAEKKERENRCFRHDSREFVRAEKLEHAIYGRSSSLINRTGTKQFFIRPCFRGGLIITEETKLLDVSNKYELALYNA